jgi:hypothetical protein
LGNFATKRRDAITRAAEIRKQFLERPIEEFYGPLLSLSSRIAAIRDIRDRLVDAFEKKGENLNGDTLVKLRRFVRTEFTMPTNRQIEQILTNRLHLLGEDNMPETFFLFLTSTIQAEIQSKLWAEQNIDSQIVRGLPFPKAFTADVARKFSELMTEYRALQGQERTFARHQRM